MRVVSSSDDTGNVAGVVMRWRVSAGIYLLLISLKVFSALCTRLQSQSAASHQLICVSRWPSYIPLAE